MIKLKFKRAVATESGDYYQIHFGEIGESDVEGTPYFLIHRSFDVEDEDEDDDPFNIETNDDSSIGHAKIIRANLTPCSLYLKTKMHPWPEILIQFETTPSTYSKLEKVFKIMFEGIPT